MRIEDLYGRGSHICTQCGTRDKPMKKPGGSLAVEILLWIFFILPGFIYSVWRHMSPVESCPACQQETMIPVDTPQGKYLVKLAAQTRR